MLHELESDAGEVPGSAVSKPLMAAVTQAEAATSRTQENLQVVQTTLAVVFRYKCRLRHLMFVIRQIQTVDVQTSTL